MFSPIRLYFQATTDGEKEQKWLGKTNFVEVRSFLQIFRSFDRMWSFLILSLQVPEIVNKNSLLIVSNKVWLTAKRFSAAS